MPKYNSLELSLDEVNDKNTIQIEQIKRNILEKPVTWEKLRYSLMHWMKIEQTKISNRTKRFIRTKDDELSS